MTLSARGPGTGASPGRISSHCDVICTGASLGRIIHKCGQDMSYYSRAHGVRACLARGQRPGWYCPGHCPHANKARTHERMWMTVWRVCTNGQGTRTASPEWERHTCKHGHTRVHKELKHRNYELRNTSLITILIFLVVTGEWARMSISWIFRRGRKWTQQESDANALSRTINERSTLVQVMAWDHQATSHSLRKCWPRLCEYIVTWPR